MIGAPRVRQLLKRLRPLRVVIDARMGDGLSGGVQQWVIGLATGLSGLPSRSEDYLFLINEGQGDWLRPHLGGRCRVLALPPASTTVARGAKAAEPSALADAVASPAAGASRVPGTRARRRRWRSRLYARLPLLGAIRRRTAGSKSERPKRRRLAPFDQLMQELGADVVHFPRQSASPTTVPSIYQPWDLQHLHLPEFFSSEVLAARDATYRRYCAQASLIIVPTTWVGDDLVAQYGIEPERIAVIHPPPPTQAYIPPSAAETEAIVARLGLPSRFALYPALAWRHKNHERLFEALARLRDRGIEVPLVCSGHRNDRYPGLVRLATELDIAGQVTFPGFLTETEIQVVYSRATILVFPSLFEGAGLPIVEAFAAGLPVTCSNVTSLPALVGDAAIVFDPTDVGAIAAAAERLWTDPDLQARLAERGRERVAQLDWGRTTQVIRAHYRRVGGRRLTAEERALVAAPALV